MKSGIIGFIVVAVIGIVIYNVCYYNTVEEVTIVVTDKERIVESSGSGEDASVSSKYLIFTESETFENTDEFWMGKWNSSDVQGGLKIGDTATVKVIGWRWAFFSMYRNIIEIK